MYLEWIETLERFFDIKDYFNEKTIKMAILELKKYASLWNENNQRQRAKEGKSRITTWSQLKKLMHKRFLPEGNSSDIYLKVSSLSEGRISVEEYVRELEQLKISSGLEDEAEQSMDRFLQG